MRKIGNQTLGLALAMATVCGSAAQAQDLFAIPTGPYLSLGAGINMPEDSDTRLIRPVTPPPGAFANTPLTLPFDTGYNITGAVGLKLDGGIRTELEFSWRDAKIQNDGMALAWTGKQQAFGIMANVLYDFETETRFIPYIGGGLGVARNRFNNVTGTPANAVFSGHDTNFQWQAIGGVSYAISDRVAVFADYRYIALDKNRIGSRTDPVSRIIDHDDRSHNVLLGVRFFLGASSEPTRTADAAPPPARTTPSAPPSPPPRPGVPEKVLAFFDFDRSALRADAKDVVRQAAEFARTNNKTVIRITGHTDSSGSSDYNLALSQRRAEAVKDELVNLGIPANEISLAWRGESELLVQSGDGVKEPQNRRVEIIYD